MESVTDIVINVSTLVFVVAIVGGVSISIYKAIAGK